MDPLDDIIGQETAKKFVRTALKKGSLYNLFLSGPRGVGKRSFAFAVAQTLGCFPGSTSLILIGAIPSKVKDKRDKIEEYMKQYLPENQIVQLEDRAAILIEQIRYLIEMLMTMPSAGTKRVTIIIEADRMTEEAANCFLKTLEEPPVDTIFILTSSRPEHVLATIQSRCQTIPFHYLPNNEIKQLFMDNGDQFMLGSPGEIMSLQQNEHMDIAKKIFESCPLSTKQAAEITRKYENGKAVELLYALILLYRMSYYQQLKMLNSIPSTVKRKATQINIPQVINAITLLNNSIIALEHNPNRVLFLLNIFTHLP
ncbi:hypothetical protein A2Y85_08010 [candidate division WOR-3 bacterium RBG_13_43_14]|uniref:AAA+ ATPase domain-containing protein n=1 Tax=candidate division WOR-3 bacterium RBG_13_43_14 TaxID=1802590 RepID=A0A1F4U1H4_UNCW3|nr:MAG: hypothetical protein A2Y85_08010 [candidate division WOR-3 bacterium RBG_13_43_14]